MSCAVAVTCPVFAMQFLLPACFYDLSMSPRVDSGVSLAELRKACLCVTEFYKPIKFVCCRFCYTRRSK